MALNLVKSVYNNEFRTSQNLAFLASCIGQKITVTTEFFHEDITIITTDNKFIFYPTQGQVNSLDTNRVIYIEDSSYFLNTQVGDTLDITPFGFGSTIRTVTDVIDGNAVRVDGAVFPTPDDTYTSGYIANITPLTGLRFAHNFLQSGYNFINQVDGQYQGYQIGTISALNTSPQILEKLGLKTWQFSNANTYIEGTGFTLSNQQGFELTSTVIVSPLFLIGEYDNLLLGIKPSYFDANKCLNYIQKIEVGKSLNNPNGLIELLQPTNQSNTGWFNEVYNGGVTKYSISSLVIKRLSDNVIVDQLQLNERMEVVITITNPTLPFSVGNSKCIFGFNILPDNESQVTNNGRTQDINYCFDSKLITANNIYVNGDLFGNPHQIIEQLKAEKVGSNLVVTAIIEPLSSSLAIIKETAERRYNFWVIVENHALTNALCDTTNLLAQVSYFNEVLTTIDLIDAETKFVQHAYSDFVDGVDVLESFPVDDISAQTNFSIDFTGRELEGIAIQSVKNTIKLTHATESDIILETFTANTSTFAIVGNQAQNIDFTQDRVFKVNESDKKTISISRDFANDLGNVRQYKAVFPFMNRWEYWVKLLGLTASPTGIFDNTKPNNGINQYWERLSNVSGWDVVFETEFEILQNGELFSQTFQKPFTLFNYEANTEWTNNSIKTYDVATNTELLFNTNKLIQGYTDTKVIATFTKTTGMLPVISDVAIVIWIETFEKGGISDIRRASSEYANFQTFFKTTVSKSNIGNVYKGECLIDFTKIPNNQKFTIYARLYEKNGAVVDTFYIINELNEIFTDGLGNQIIYLQ